MVHIRPNFCIGDMDSVRRHKKLIDPFFWLLAAVVIITPRVMNLDVFYARDELAIWPWADQFALAVWAGDWAGTLTSSDYPGIPMFWAQTLFLTIKYHLPSLFESTMIPLDQLFDFRTLPLLAERRMAGGVLVSGQLLVAVWLVKRLWGWRTALLAAIFLGLDPFSLTEARVFRLEMVSAGFITLSVLAYLLYWQNEHRRWVLLSGVMAGLAVSGKTSGGLIVPFIWLLLLLELFRDGLSPGRFKHVVLTGLLWAGGAIAAFWLIWPAMWVEPLAAVQHLWQTGFAQAADRSVWGDEVFFWGQVIKGGDPGPWFYPAALAFRTTPLTWVGLALVIGWLGRQIINYRTFTARKTFLPTVQLLLFVLLMLLEMTFIISKVDRFLIIIFPALSILTAVGLAQLSRINFQFSIFKAKLNIQQSTFQLIFFAAVMIGAIATMLPHHPYYYTYWNPLTGGGKMAMKLLPIGAGEGVDLAMDYLNRQPDAANLTVVCGGSQPWCARAFRGTAYRSATYASGEWFQADYASFYISHLQRQKYPPEIVEFFQGRTPAYEVKLGGVDYMQLYKVPQTAHVAGAWNNLAGQGRLLGYDLGASPQQAGNQIEATVWWVKQGDRLDNLVIRLVDQSGYEWSRTPVTPAAEFQQAGILAGQPAVVKGAARLTLPPGMPPGPYFWRIGATAAEGKLAGEFTLPDETDQLVIEPGPIFTEADQFDINTRLNQALAPGVTLLGYTPPAGALNPDQPEWLSLYWQATAPPPDYLIRVRLRNPETGQTIEQQRRPGYDRFPTNQWQPGQIVQDVWAWQPPPDVKPGQYTLEIALTRPNAPSEPVEPAVVIPNVEVWPQPLTFAVPDMQGQLNATFADRLTLLGYDLYFDTDGTSRAGQLSPVLYWQSQTDFEAAYEIRFTLRAADTEEALQTWQVPLGRDGAKVMWQQAEVISSIYQFDLVALTNGRYHLDIALQNQTTGNIEQAGDRSFVRIEDIQDKVVVRVR